MANFFNLSLDTTGPVGASVVINGGANYTNAQLVTLAIATADGDTTNYQMKIWGDVDPVADANVQVAEGDSVWTAFAASKDVTVAAGDGMKTINIKLRDDVLNESGSASDSIVLDISVPAVTVTGPDVSKVSKNVGKNVCSFSFAVDQDITDYKIKVVPNSGSAEDAGTVIGTANGSTNMNYSGVAIVASTVIDCTINGADLEAASAGDGVKVIKVFVREASGNWSS